MPSRETSTIILLAYQFRDFILTGHNWIDYINGDVYHLIKVIIRRHDRLEVEQTNQQPESSAGRTRTWL